MRKKLLVLLVAGATLLVLGIFIAGAALLNEPVENSAGPYAPTAPEPVQYPDPDRGEAYVAPMIEPTMDPNSSSGPFVPIAPEPVQYPDPDRGEAYVAPMIESTMDPNSSSGPFVPIAPEPVEYPDPDAMAKKDT